MSDEDLTAAVAKAGGRVLIGFKDPGAEDGVDAAGKVVASQAARTLGRDVVLATGSRILYEFRTIPGVVAELDGSLVAELRANPRIDFLEPDALGEWSTQVTPWNISAVQAPAAWSLSTGSGVKLLILDSGAPAGGHRDLSIPVSFRCLSGPVADTTIGHGTHVAGIAAALNNSVDVVGVAHAATLWMANITVGTFPSSAEAACAVDVGSVNGVFAVNMSIAVSASTMLTNAINTGYTSYGMLFVAAAGNTNGGGVTYPATLANVIAVTAVDASNARASFAAIGPSVEMAAPGVSILSTALTGGSSCGGTYVAYCSGTSMAAPHVAAAATLLKARYPSWSNTTVRARLQATATDLGAYGKDNTFGYGLLNADRAIRMTVAVGGPSYAYSGYPQTWTAYVSGGQSPYSYQWYVNGTPTGTGVAYTYTPGGSNFWIKVRATDALSYVATDSLFVTVSSCTPPDIIC